MQLNNKKFLIVILLILFSQTIFAQSIPVPQIKFSPRKYICYFTHENITIDGKLDETSWKNVKWTEDFVDIEGDLKPKPRFNTKVKMLWDKNYFYIAAQLEEPHIWATLKNRDDIIFYDNDFEVFIDPDGDTHRYVEFEMNALNTVWDLFLIKPYRDTDKAALHGFDIKNLKSAVSIFGSINNPSDIDSCWTLEIAFPWEAFKEITSANVPPQDNDQWRINFSRVEWRTNVVNSKYEKVINPETNKPYPEDNWVWSPQGVINMHYPEMWGYVQFSKIEAGKGYIDFIENQSEQIKWYLRNIYYQQRAYFDKNKKYADNISALGIEPLQINGIFYTPEIKVIDDMYKCTFLDDENIYTLYHDGLINIKKN
ncbi:carbohydrate-binding family 9-like protein [Rosettibacter firmus]|uniref:carbohydrate-binding family 9-like protein n=1 Tax=Rosettibacter firmus TaxID=3111522 RepID=UPI00336BE737